MFPEDALVPLSALQHYIFCPRQCALIHVEGLWAENRLTVEGRHLHERADGSRVGPRGGGRVEVRARRGGRDPAGGAAAAHEEPGGTGGAGGFVRTVRALPIRSLRLGLIGKADVVEFHGRGGAAAVPFPVEYKRGRPKAHRADEVQLCAQALCLEEMLGLGAGGVPAGALFYGLTRRRVDVAFDGALRSLTEATAARVHALIAAGVTPRAAREKKCGRCSLVNLCLPDATGPSRSAARYIARGLEEHLAPA